MQKQSLLTAASIPFAKVIGILAVLLLLGCQEDLAPLSAKWASKASTYSTEIETLKKRHDGLKARVHAIDPAGKSGTAKVSLEQALKRQNEEFLKLDEAMAHARAMVDVAKKGGKRDSMLIAMELADRELPSQITRADQLLQAEEKAVVEAERAATQ